jgi:hypothetical protein
MLFTDLTDPAAIVALLVAAALFGLAFAAAFPGVLIRPAHWLASGLAAVLLALGLVGAAGMALELWTARLPLTLPDAPLGTYARMTQLGLLLGIAQFGLTAVGAALAFRRPGLGGLILALVGFLNLLEAARTRLQDPTLPQDSFVVGMAFAILVLAVGALALATWRAGRASATGRRGTRVPQGRRRHPHPHPGAPA